MAPHRGERNLSESAYRGPVINSHLSLLHNNTAPNECRHREAVLADCTLQCCQGHSPSNSANEKMDVGPSTQMLLYMHLCPITGLLGFAIRDFVRCLSRSGALPRYRNGTLRLGVITTCTMLCRNPRSYSMYCCTTTPCGLDLKNPFWLDKNVEVRCDPPSSRTEPRMACLYKRKDKYTGPKSQYRS
jgi:hypothetical protein